MLHLDKVVESKLIKPACVGQLQKARRPSRSFLLLSSLQSSWSVSKTNFLHSTLIPHWLSAFQHTLYSLQSFLFAAQRKECFSFQVKQVLFAHKRRLAEVS